MVKVICMKMIVAESDELKKCVLIVRKKKINCDDIWPAYSCTFQKLQKTECIDCFHVYGFVSSVS